MKRIFFFMCVFLFVIQIKAQVDVKSTTGYFEEGKASPNIRLIKIENYKSSQTSIDELKGRWIYLDFWDKHCGACIESFPHVDSLRREFSNSMDFFLIGKEDKEGQARSIYGQIHKRMNLNVPGVFDSLLFKQLDILTVPYIVVIDPNGIVKAVTYKTSRKDLSDMMAGNAVTFPKAYRQHEHKNEFKPQFDSSKLFLINGNGGTDTAFLFRSVLSAWKPSISNPYSYSVDLLYSIQKEFPQFMGVRVQTLLFFAYTGMDGALGFNPLLKSPTHKYSADEFYPQPILEIKDKTLFERPDLKTGQNLFCYSLKVPKESSTLSRVMSIMQKDLENYFGLKAKVEEREFPYWKLIVEGQAKKKFATKGNETFKKYTGTMVSLRNQPIKAMLTFNYAPDGLPIGDGTGMDNIDIDLNYAQISFDDYRRELKEKGFDLIKSTKKMKCLVVQDVDYPIDASK